MSTLGEAEASATAERAAGPHGHKRMYNMYTRIYSRLQPLCPLTPF